MLTVFRGLLISIDKYMQKKERTEDHDILIRIDEKLRLLSTEFGNFRTDNDRRLHMIEQSYISKTDVMGLKAAADSEHKDYESRIRRLERWGFFAIGGLALLQIIIRL